MASHQSKKRKTNAESAHEVMPSTPDTSKPTAVYKPGKGRKHTLTIALPGSIVANAQTHDAKTALAGALARAASVFTVDEIVIFSDQPAHSSTNPENPRAEANGYTAFSDPDHFLFHVLSYLETPPHLRKRLFPMHPDLRTAGALPSLDLPSHQRDGEGGWREGVAIGKAPGGGTEVEVGLPHRVALYEELEEGVRVTVKVSGQDGDYLTGQAVGPGAPREEGGFYWGYQVRRAGSLSAVFTEAPWDGGYDVSVGTSERGVSVNELLEKGASARVAEDWRHLIVVFGGVAGLEVALANDYELQGAGVTQASEVFDRWVNLVPNQGSRTIRTEEAVWCGLMGLRPLVETRNAA